MSIFDDPEFKKHFREGYRKAMEDTTVKRLTADLAMAEELGMSVEQMIENSQPPRE